MKFSSFSRLLIAGIFVWLFTISAAAQDTGGGFGSYTFIDYDEETNIVTAYSQTDSDYNLMGDYQARVSLTVTNDYGVIVASGSAYDYGDGYASVELSFAGEAGRTYTAVGTHRVYAYLYDYDYDDYYLDSPYYYKSRVYYYYDNWYFTGFEGGSIYQPWYYSFYRPSYSYFRRRTRTISLGRTYDSLSTQTYSFRGSIQAQGPDISYGNRRIDLGDSVFGNKDTVSRAWAQNIPLGALTGIEYANAVKSKMTPTQLSNREAAFTNAKAFIERCGVSGGCPPRNYPFYGLNGTRVDVVINAGTNFVFETTAE